MCIQKSVYKCSHHLDVTHSSICTISVLSLLSRIFFLRIYTNAIYGTDCLLKNRYDNIIAFNNLVGMENDEKLQLFQRKNILAKKIREAEKHSRFFQYFLSAIIVLISYSLLYAISLVISYLTHVAQILSWFTARTIP